MHEIQTQSKSFEMARRTDTGFLPSKSSLICKSWICIHFRSSVTFRNNEQYQLILCYMIRFNLTHLNNSSQIWETMFLPEGNNCLRLLLVVLAGQAISCKYCKILNNIYTTLANAILLLILTVKFICLIYYVVTSKSWWFCLSKHVR